MKIFLILLLMLSLISCSSTSVELEQAAKLQPLFYARVIDKSSIVLAANESLSERVLVGLVTGGVVGAVATASTEENFGKPLAFRYELNINGKSKVEVVDSFSDVEQSACVKVLKSSESKALLLLLTKKSFCVGSN